jgi:hypothetical protein
VIDGPAGRVTGRAWPADGSLSWLVDDGHDDGRLGTVLLVVGER